MFLKGNLLIIGLILLLSSPVYGISGMSDLQRLGQGKAYYLGFIKVYDVSLYGSELTSKQHILSRDVSKCLHIEYAVDIEKDDFVEAANTILNRQFSEKQLALAKGGIDALHEAYLDVKDGDTYTLCYSSLDSVTTLSYNGEELVSIDSPFFAETYFSIWLGSHKPLDEDLRDDLLAGVQKD